ncbi:hypothetical protein, partial [Fulvivirga sp. M361]|uniref:hypothetical protein n=1 Tax=Fulvivirga sp. M361 TaxID=2594266 RepID=UPI001C86B353
SCPIAATLRNALASLKRRVFSSRKITGFRPTLKYAVLRMDTKHFISFLQKFQGLTIQISGYPGFIL